MSNHYRPLSIILTALLLVGCGTAATPSPTLLAAATHSPTVTVIASTPTAAATAPSSPSAAGPTRVNLSAEYPIPSTFPNVYQITVIADPPNGAAPLTVRLRATVIQLAPVNLSSSTPSPGPCFFPQLVYEFGDGVKVSPDAACGVAVYGPLTPVPPTAKSVPYPMTTRYVSEPHAYTHAGTYHAAMVLRWNGQELRGETIVQVQ